MKLRFSLLALLLAPSAAASQEFPDVLEARYGLAKAPDCVLCHRDDKGGPKTIVTPFGRTMLKLQVVGANVRSLEAALDIVDARGIDSDHDGLTDTDELSGAGDPNVPRAAPDGGVIDVPVEPPLLETGCAVRAPRDPAALPVALSAWVAAYAFVLRARRVARRRRDVIGRSMEP